MFYWCCGHFHRGVSKRDDGCAPLLAPSERTQWKGTSANSKEKQGGEEGRRSQQGQAGRKISPSSCAASLSLWGSEPAPNYLKLRTK